MEQMGGMGGMPGMEGMMGGMPGMGGMGGDDEDDDDDDDDDDVDDVSSQMLKSARVLFCAGNKKTNSSLFKSCLTWRKQTRKSCRGFKSIAKHATREYERFLV
jgi:hypothetical protein